MNDGRDFQYFYSEKTQRSSFFQSPKNDLSGIFCIGTTGSLGRLHDQEKNEIIPDWPKGRRASCFERVAPCPGPNVRVCAENES